MTFRGFPWASWFSISPLKGKIILRKTFRSILNLDFPTFLIQVGYESIQDTFLQLEILMPQCLKPVLPSLYFHITQKILVTLRTNWKEFGSLNKAAHLALPECWGSQDVGFVCLFFVFFFLNHIGLLCSIQNFMFTLKSLVQKLVWWRSQNGAKLVLLTANDNILSGNCWLFALNALFCSVIC